MKSVNVTELRTRLSAYLNEVKAGQEIVIHDRTGKIARIIPMNRTDNEDEELLALAAQGKVRLGEGAIGEEFWEMPTPDVPIDVVRRVMEQERDED